MILLYKSVNKMNTIDVLLIVIYPLVHEIYPILKRVVTIIVLTPKCTDIAWRCPGLAAVLAISAVPHSPKATPPLHSLPFWKDNILQPARTLKSS